MPTNRTIIITFGYRHGAPPIADVTVDCREIDDHDYHKWGYEADAIIEAIEPGMVVALGCMDGDDRSVHIARLIQKKMDNVVVVDRDLSPEAHTQEDTQDATSTREN